MLPKHAIYIWKVSTSLIINIYINYLSRQDNTHIHRVIFNIIHDYLNLTLHLTSNFLLIFSSILIFMDRDTNFSCHFLLFSLRIKYQTSYLTRIFRTNYNTQFQKHICKITPVRNSVCSSVWSHFFLRLFYAFLIFCTSILNQVCHEYLQNYGDYWFNYLLIKTFYKYICIKFTII